ncbi:hypothetical protein BJV78DRAFT_409222 [Lactifluus subvellereus]|nr:hypothetical protein BJV78DRAFT_409222 [Lactifluus subvellereus]
MIIDHKEAHGFRDEKARLEGYDVPGADFATVPPAYTSNADASTSSSVVVASPLHNRLPIVAAPPSVPTNGVSIFTVLEPIKGSWLLDPLAAQTSAPSILQALVENRAGRRPRRFRNMTMGAPTARLDSRHGNISATIRVVGESAMPVTATIRSATRSSNIVLELVSKSPSRTVHFDAYSRSGNISLLIPRSFSGLVELRARRGDIELLPALVSSCRVVKATDRETVVLVGNGVLPQVGLPSVGDLARLCARSGRVRLGFSGEDAFIESAGVMATATHLFRKLATRSANP